MNTLYDLPGQPLRKRGDLLRLRKYGDEWVLTHKSKGVAGRHKTRVELETKVDDGARTDAILRALNFQPTFRYEKFRAEWSDGNGHVVVDHTPIGDFGTDTYAGLFFAWKRRTRSPANEMTFRAVGKKSAVGR
jgi:adenylate cyclase class 2